MTVRRVIEVRRWARAPLAQRLRFVIVVFCAVLLAGGVTLLLVLRQADRALSEQARRTAPARVAAGQLLTSLVDQETGLRGYALTGDERFLDPYRRGLVNEQRRRAQLERLVRPGEPAHLALLTVDAAITAWRDQYASLLTGGRGASGSDATIQFGRELFQRVRDTHAVLDARLANQVRIAQDHVDRDRHLVVVVLGVMAVAVAVSVVGLLRALDSMVLGPMGELGDQVAAVSGGEHDRAITPNGPPDLQAMGRGVESMRQELVEALAELHAQQRTLETWAAELARSNADLEQFAYVASHDLQEPLRKVANFCGLLEERYRGQLDDRADQYIDFAVDGARRMQQLITDLLTFSRVGRTTAGFAEVDVADVVAEAWSVIGTAVQAAGADLAIDIDPDAAVVVGDRSLLHMLLVNLLGNAVKFRRTDVSPQARFRATADGAVTRLSVDDNGIGVPPEFADKVFVIFQRLHARDSYEGTGIGLALAKKIVEFHGGTIELVPSSLGGTCVSFTVPRERSVSRV